MKTNVLSNSPTHSTAIEEYRRGKAMKSSRVMYELPNGIRKRDIGWIESLLGGLATFSIGFFFILLLFVTLVFGPKF